VKKLSIALSVLLFSLLAAASARAQFVSNGVVNFLYNFQVCTGPYALCAASTCTPTGGTITVNVAGGGTASFPEAACTCPVFYGPAMADLSGGNMQGSCKPPGLGKVWSLYGPKARIPQAINDWQLTTAATAAPLQLCSASENIGASYANCYSFACTLDRKHPNGVPTATCSCPLGEDSDGEAVGADTPIITRAGQCNSDICGQHPVGLPFPAAGSQANKCLELSGESPASVGLVP
jgi:hypothetical protein